MKDTEIEQIKTIITETVNGKIDKLHIELRQYIKEDTEWKERAEPVILMGNNVRGFGKVSLYILGFVAAIIGAILGIISLINKK